MIKPGKFSLWKRITTILAISGMLQSLIVPTGKITASDEGEIATNYIVQINETVTDGFTHPGVGLTKSKLETIRSMVSAKKEPWYSYYKAMTVSSSASKTVISSNQSSANPTKPASDAFNSQGFNSRFIADGLKAYTQTLMYYITGDVTYRANAMHIIRIWSQMDPNKYVYFNDSHIHTGIPLNRMVAAAEILRYTSSPNPELAWTEKDTADFTSNLVTPVIENFLHDNNRFMNQHNYPLLGAMAGYIFTNNTERYEEAVEWFTVNTTAKNQGFNGSVKQLFRLIDSNVVTGEPVNPL
ncbi:alginate lyase family protein [Paenibacillus sp. DCT19]|uniref:alginate lyase family protein n=1 Tax=Paenibacillus sp. DCT19 TaxID=2211212 RepID=UPI0020C53F96|nr:alginate lyase family protein [Paenibacillus sp. DCT19]